MSTRYPGGIISKTAPVPTGGESGTAPGVWTLEQAAYYIKQGQWPIPYIPKYVEDVFSTYLYAGNSSTQTITNGIDLSGKGGLVWLKYRSGGNASGHWLYDTARGTTKALSTDTTSSQSTNAASLTSFNSTGFSLGSYGEINYLTGNYASWTFREQPKFFDIVTYTGNGVGGRNINHNLGSAPGCIIIKCTSTSSTNWMVWHRSISGQDNLRLNTTDGVTGVTDPISVPGFPSSLSTTQFTVDVGTGSDLCNVNGATYVAYLFAHDAGGFGASGNDNVISCGSFTTDGTGFATVTLGYEPQLVIVKSTSASGNWFSYDNMRGMPASGSVAVLYPNLSNAEINTSNKVNPTSTGFTVDNVLNTTYIYIAIRRGPMKTPTSGTSVFGLNARSGTGANATVTGGQVDDAVLIKNRGSAVGDLFAARLTGTGYLETSANAAEVAAGTTILQSNPWDVMDGVKVGTTSTITNASSNTFINYLFRRAPGFFDVVCYTGTGVARTVNHNLGVVPEMMIVKSRSNGSEGWRVWQTSIAAINSGYVTELNGTDGLISSPGTFNSTAPTSTVFTVGNNPSSNGSGSTYVAYLFASCAGVSKVGSYTGTGTTQQINCGFTGGARFVLIKRTDSTGDWYVWDSARGIVAGNDPYLLLNSTAAEVTNTDYVDTYAAGFEISSTAPAAINANGGTFIYLAIA